MPLPSALVAGKRAEPDGCRRSIQVADRATQAASRSRRGVKDTRRAAQGDIAGKGCARNRQRAGVDNGAAEAHIRAVGLVVHERRIVDGKAGPGADIDGAALGVASGVPDGLIAGQDITVQGQRRRSANERCSPLAGHPPR